MEEFDLQPDERVIRTVRQHIFVLVLTLLPFLFLALVPSIISAALNFVLNANLVPGISPDILNSGAATFFTGLWWLFVWMGAFLAFMRYYLTLWVITTTRIVDIEQRGLFSRTVSSFLLTRVQDVTTDISGLVATVIGYGRLTVQTAGQSEDFFLDGVPHPQIVRDVIMDQVAELHRDQLVVGGV